ncbi:MAG: twin-arginine translocation signal domain-containing protein [Candidatus Omnitrophica bacterium]|nr:twin-arginine translocation signal domain-containing protein [Candidatus Omnitrophota bacterium]
MAKEISRRDFLKLAALATAGAVLEAACGSTTPTPTPTPTPKEAPQPKETNEVQNLPYFRVEGVPPVIYIDPKDPRVANNGPDAAGIDHQNPFMPKGAAWLIVADPGHYRVDSLANVTDPKTRAFIERDIRNGAAFEGEAYKGVLTGQEAVLPLWENGGAVILTGAQPGILTTEDADGKPVEITLGRQNNHGWVVVFVNGLKRDGIRGTDTNRALRLTQYDPGFTMWQGIPPGMFISEKYVAQTISDAHGNYRDRGTSPGQGQDGVNNVSVLLAKILPEGVVYTLLQHNDPNTPWGNYKPNDFVVIANNVILK